MQQELLKTETVEKDYTLPTVLMELDDEPFDGLHQTVVPETVVPEMVCRRFFYNHHHCQCTESTTSIQQYN